MSGNRLKNSYAGRPGAAGAFIRGDNITLHPMPRSPAAPSRADEVIRSRTNPLVKRLRALKEKGQRGAAGLMLLEGGRLVQEALQAGVEVVEAVASPRFGSAAPEAGLTEELTGRGVALHRLEVRLLASLSELETSPGLLAIARRPAFTEEALYRGRPLVLIAAGLQNPGNLGGLLRSGEAAGATGAYLTEGTADPFSWKALRGSMGSAFRLPHVRGLSARDAVERARRHGLQVVATQVQASQPYDEVDFAAPTALVFGAEGSGLAAELAAAADQRVQVPMQPPVESLNVGVAAGILLFEAMRQRRRGASLAKPRTAS
jgi:TrmH family RNA methyltransferase